MKRQGKMSEQEYDWWVAATIKKSSLDALIVIATLLKAGLGKGTCSGNDLVGITYGNPHVVGSCFRVLARAGFIKTDRIVASERKPSHASFVLVWTLADRSKAEAFQGAISGALLSRNGGQGWTQEILKM